MTTNVTRQPTVSVATASGSPASSRPNWLSANSQLSTVAHDWSRIPARDQHDAGHEAAGAAEADDEAGQRQTGARLGGGVQQRARRHQHGQDGHREARADAVEGNADRDLRQQQGGEEAAVGKAQRFRRQRQVADELGPDHRIGGAEELRQDRGRSQHRQQDGRFPACRYPNPYARPKPRRSLWFAPEISNVSAIHHSRLITIVLLSHSACRRIDREQIALRIVARAQPLQTHARFDIGLTDSTGRNLSRKRP